MAKDIKTRKKQPKTIKTMKGTVKNLDRSLRAGRDIKEISERVLSQDTPDNAPAELLQSGERWGAEFAGRKTTKTAYRSARSAVSVKQRTSAARESFQTAKATFKESRSAIRAEIKSVKTSVKTARNTIKTANSARKAGSSAAKGASTAAKGSFQAAKAVAKTTFYAAKVTAKAFAAAIKTAVEAISASVEAIGAFLAAGGWIVLVAILIVVILAALFSSAFGIHFADDANPNALSTVQQEINREFSEKLSEQKALLQGYDRIVVRPAPSVTKWNEILAVYSTRAQNENLVPIEMNEQTESLLRDTMWNMISFSVSSETVTSVESDEAGNSITVTEAYGVVTVMYKSTEEMATLYQFSDGDRETLSQVLSMYADFGGITVGNAGNGRLINPCPDGHFNGNDFPAYAGSGEYHAGRDISCPIGTPIYAAADGTVIHINDQAETYGNHIMISHSDEIYTLYAHCDSLLVSVGQDVKQGQQIAWSGATGNVTGSHLHFEVRVGGSKYRVNNVDPLDWIA